MLRARKRKPRARREFWASLVRGQAERTLASWARLLSRLHMGEGASSSAGAEEQMGGCVERKALGKDFLQQKHLFYSTLENAENSPIEML